MEKNRKQVLTHIAHFKRFSDITKYKNKNSQIKKCKNRTSLDNTNLNLDLSYLIIDDEVQSTDDTLKQLTKSKTQKLQTSNLSMDMITILEQQQFSEKYQKNPFFKQRVNLMLQECKKIVGKNDSTFTTSKLHQNEKQYYRTLKGKRQQRKQQMKGIINKCQLALNIKNIR